MKGVMDLTNRTPEELADMVLICPVHKLLCTACEHSTRIPRSWLSNEVQRELGEIDRRQGVMIERRTWPVFEHPRDGRFVVVNEAALECIEAVADAAQLVYVNMDVGGSYHIERKYWDALRDSLAGMRDRVQEEKETKA